MIASHDADYVTGRDTGLAKSARECIRATVDLVEGRGPLVVDDRDRVRLADGQRDEAHRRGFAPSLCGADDSNGLVRSDRFEDPGSIQHLCSL